MLARFISCKNVTAQTVILDISSVDFYVAYYKVCYPPRINIVIEIFNGGVFFLFTERGAEFMTQWEKRV